MTTNELIKAELSNFISNVQDKSKYQKKMYHYNTTINLSEGLLMLSDVEQNISHKKLILDYFHSLKASNYLIDKEKSMYYYKNYLLPTGQVMIKKFQYGTSWDILKYIFLGIIIDYLMFLFLNNYFFVTPVLIIIGYIRRQKKIKEKRFFSLNW